MRGVIFILSLVVLALALSLGALASNGVFSTAPPGLGARLRLALTVNTAAIAPDSVYPELRPVERDTSPDALAAAVAAACTRLGWTVATDPGAPRTVHAVITSPLLRFRDDLTIRAIDGAVTGTASLRGESRARIGRADYGANAAHLRRLLAELARR